MSVQVGLGVFASLESQSLTQGGEFISSSDSVCFTFWLCQFLLCVFFVCCDIYTCLGFFCPFVVVKCLFITGDNPCLRPWHGQCVHDLSFYLKRVSYGDPVVHLGLTKLNCISCDYGDVWVLHLVSLLYLFFVFLLFWRILDSAFLLLHFISSIFWGGAALGFTNFIFRFS